MSRRFALVCTAVLCAAFVAGCGGPSKEEWAREANSVCSRIQEDLKAEASKGQTKNKAEVRRRTDQQIRAFEIGVQRLSDLDKPGGEAGEQVDRFTADFKSFLGVYRPAVEEVQAALSRGDRQALITAARELRNTVREKSVTLNRVGKQLNVPKCASGG